MCLQNLRNVTENVFNSQNESWFKSLHFCLNWIQSIFQLAQRKLVATNQLFFNQNIGAHYRIRFDWNLCTNTRVNVWNPFRMSSFVIHASLLFHFNWFYGYYAQLTKLFIFFARHFGFSFRISFHERNNTVWIGHIKEVLLFQFRNHLSQKYMCNKMDRGGGKWVILICYINKRQTNIVPKWLLFTHGANGLPIKPYYCCRVRKTSSEKSHSLDLNPLEFVFF